MCSVDTYDKLYLNFYDSVSSGGHVPLPYGSTIGVLKSLCNNINCIEVWLQTFETYYIWSCNWYPKKEYFSKNTPRTLPVTKPSEFKKKN